MAEKRILPNSWCIFSSSLRRYSRESRCKRRTFFSFSVTHRVALMPRKWHEKTRLQSFMPPSDRSKKKKKRTRSSWCKVHRGARKLTVYSYRFQCDYTWLQGVAVWVVLATVTRCRNAVSRVEREKLRLEMRCLGLLQRITSQLVKHSLLLCLVTLRALSGNYTR